MRKFSQIITLNVRKSICENKKITVQNREKRNFCKEKSTCFCKCFFSGDPYGNRTHVTAVKGPCLNLLTNGPSFEGYTGEMLTHLSGVVAATGFEPVTLRV